jgi:hypothetical protein
MKVGRIPVAAIALLLVAFGRYLAKFYYDPIQYAYTCFALDGVLIGVMLCYLLYYGNIYLSAWLKNRKDESAV